MSSLSDQDYKNILSFYTKLNRNYDDFENNTLRLLQELFDLRLTTYAIFDQDNSGRSYVRKIISHTIRTDHLEQYRTRYYKLDVFHQNIQHLIYDPAYEYVYTSDDLGPEQFENSEFGKWLASLKVAHQAILGGTNSTKRPTHVLCVYKTHSQGSFTPRELELFYQIGMVFSNSMGLYKKHLQQKRVLELTNGFTDTIPLGFAILDQDQDLLNHNAQFISFGIRLSDKMEVTEIVQDLIAEIYRQSPSDQGGIRRAHMAGCTVMLQEKKLYVSPGFESHSFLSIQEDTWQKPSASSVQEQLTDRESEVAKLLLKEQSNAEIARQLFISESTVKSHLRNMSIKLGATSRAELQQRIRGLGHKP